MKDQQVIELLRSMCPNALRAIAAHCEYGSKKHSPGEPVHWAYYESMEHIEKAIGHAKQADVETGKDHTINAAWRMIFALETRLIQAGAVPGDGVRFETPAQRASARPEKELGA
jgi:hypothetical protein